MFHPETEDLLPRSAPKPCAGVTTMNCAKPTVPEVSILDLPVTPSQSQSKQLQLNKPGTYAEWKKQCLPHVAYSYQQDNMKVENPIQRPCSPLYPMRVVQAQQANSLPVGTNANIQSIPRNNSNDLYSRGYYQSTDNNEVFAKRINNNNVAGGTAVPIKSKSPTPPLNSNQHGHNSPNYNINKQDLLAPIINPINDVLTICAGTQTNTTNEPISTLNVATKDDINDIMNYLKEIRTEQIQLLQTIHEMRIQKKTLIMKDSAIQCELMPTSIPRIEDSPLKKLPIIYDYIAEESVDENLYRDSRHHAYSNTTNSTNNPSAVSSPAPQQYQNRNNYAITPRSNVLPILPKPTTEKSMVMNELALKYLPNDKLSDLLQEIRLSENDLNPTSSPMSVANNVGKGPSDMSNASYKYLKKYRLLPEESNNQKNQHAQYNNKQMYNQQDVMIGDLEAIKRHPKFL